jgi:3-oxoacyl-[acyl-carrier-protein] synthase-3
MAKSVGVSVDKFPMTVPTYGNLAPAAVPFTLAKQVPLLRPDQRVMLLGIGSGLNTSFAEIIW